MHSPIRFHSFPSVVLCIPPFASIHSPPCCRMNRPTSRSSKLNNLQPSANVLMKWGKPAPWEDTLRHYEAPVSGPPEAPPSHPIAGSSCQGLRCRSERPFFRRSNTRAADEPSPSCRSWSKRISAPGAQAGERLRQALPQADLVCQPSGSPSHETVDTYSSPSLCTFPSMLIFESLYSTFGHFPQKINDMHCVFVLIFGEGLGGSGG